MKTLLSKRGIWIALMAAAMAVAVVAINRAGTPTQTEAAASDYTLVSMTTFKSSGGGRVDWSPDGEWIAFDSQSGSSFDVYRIRPDGTDQECLTCNHPGISRGNSVGNPAWRDGRWLLFQVEKSSHSLAGGTSPGGGVYNDLWVMDTESQTQNAGYYDVWQLTNVRSGYPVGGSLHAHFSHSGDELLWGDLEGSGGCFGNWRLVVADFTISGGTPSLSNNTYYQPGATQQWYEAQDWAEDDSGIYFTGNLLSGQDDRTEDQVYMDLSTQNWYRLVETSGLNGEDDDFDEHVKINPNSDALILMSSKDYPNDLESCDHRSVKKDLWVADMDGGNAWKLTHFNDSGYSEYDSGGVIASDLSWNPDGTQFIHEVYHMSDQRVELKMLTFSRGGSTPTPTYTPTITPTPTSTPTGCTAGDTGWLNPSANAADSGGDGNGFESNPTNAYSDGSGNATNANGRDDRHRYYNYGVSIPAGCSIKGIEVRMDWWLDATSGDNSQCAELSWNGATSWTSQKCDTVESTSEHTGTVGGSTDLWGRSWTVSEMSNANLRVRLTDICENGLFQCGLRDYYLDWVPIKVHYGP